ncbi:MAG: hypothetical protein GF313_00010 [Caldithrix sp.]|nr:hypothetical protein [Caldithrix sp.]
MHKIEYRIVQLLLKFFNYLSFKAGKRMALILYFFIAHVFRYRRRVIKDNLHRVYKSRWPKPPKELINLIYKNFVFLWMEFLQSKKLSRDNLQQHFKLHNEEMVEEALSKGHGVILISGHFGNFEWLGRMHGLMGHPVNGIAKAQSNPYVNELVEKHRSDENVKVIYTREAMEKGVKALQNNEILAIVTDQDARKRGIFVDFLGYPSSTAVGTAVFHLRTGAPIISIISVRRDYGQFEVYYEKVAEGEPTAVTDEKVRHITQQHTKALEKWVLKYPEQWFWMHRRWKTKPLEM